MKNRLNPLIVSLSALGLFASGAGAAPERPNVIMILIDDMGWADSSTYGSDYYETPNLTRLAKEGMLFTDAYAAAPLCSPTRASIMSGQYPARLRMTQAITPKDVPEPRALPPTEKEYCGEVQNKNHMPLEVLTLAETLRDAGYQTAHIGKWHLAPSGKRWSGTGDEFCAENQGFDFVIGGAHLPGPTDYYSPYVDTRSGRVIRNLSPGPEGEYLNERLAEESIKWINSVKDSWEPFYLNFWHYAVHGPIIPKKDLLPKYMERRNPNSNQRCPEMATMLDSMDNSIGILLDWLDRPENRDLKSNTVIILTSDNGGVIHNELNGNPWTSNRPLRGGKANLYEGGVREPWIVRWPGVIRPGSTCKTPVQSIDIYPTVLDMAGLKFPRKAVLDGQSIVPLLKGRSMDHQPIFTHFPHNMGVLNAASTSVRDGDYKLIRYYHAGENAESHAYELFDLKRDLYESINLAAYLPEKVKELDRLIDSFLEETEALVPERNTTYSGIPTALRSNPALRAGRPQQLWIPEPVVRTAGAGSRRVQLFDQQHTPRQTHALVLEGNEWVSVQDYPDGSVEVSWTAIPESQTAVVLFGWKGGATPAEVDDWSLAPCELTLGPSVDPLKAEPPQVKPVATVSSESFPWIQGFNSGFLDTYVGQSFGVRFGITSPGIVTDGSLDGIEGDGFAGLNARSNGADGNAGIVGGMDISLGTVYKAGAVYTFSGKFGWRYGPEDRAADLGIYPEQSGFLIAGEKPSSMKTPPFRFDASVKDRLSEYTFCYETRAADVGLPISLRLRLVDRNRLAGLTQLLTDDWRVTKTEP